jgi:hypothetical protein
MQRAAAKENVYDPAVWESRASARINPSTELFHVWKQRSDVFAHAILHHFHVAMEFWVSFASKSKAHTTTRPFAAPAHRIREFTRTSRSMKPFGKLW